MKNYLAIFSHSDAFHKLGEFTYLLHCSPFHIFADGNGFCAWGGYTVFFSPECTHYMSTVMKPWSTLQNFALQELQRKFGSAKKGKSFQSVSPITRFFSSLSLTRPEERWKKEKEIRAFPMFSASNQRRPCSLISDFAPRFSPNAIFWYGRKK